MEKYYKILRNGLSCHGGDHKWEPGVLYEVDKVIPCESGFHACRLQDLGSWLTYDMEIWEIELGGVVTTREKVVGRTAKLTRRLGSFAMDKQVEFAQWCANRADASVAAYDAAYADTYAAADASARANAADAARAAARAAAYAADAARAAARAAADAVRAAARAAADADAAAYAATYAAARAAARAYAAYAAAAAATDTREAQGRRILELLT